MGIKPTHKRYGVLFVVCCIYFITYLDRVNMSVAAPIMMREYGIDKVQLGMVFSAFMLSYVILQLPVGMLGDRFGPRLVLSGMVAVWSLVTLSTTLAWSFAALVGFRLLFGCTEAGAFTLATRAFSHWIPATERGFAQGLTHGFSRLGGAVTPVLLAPIIFAYGWRVAFVLCAAVGLIWAAFWFIWYRDTPKQFNDAWGGVSEAEIDLINRDKKPKNGKRLGIATMCRSRNMWALCAGYFCYVYNLWIFLTWLPTYLVDARGFTILKMGIFASIPLLAGTLGDTLGGWLSDQIWKRTGRANFSRRVVGMAGLIVAACFMIPGAMTASAPLAVTFLAASLFGLEMAVGVYWAVCLDIGDEYAGTVASMMNCFGNIGSILSPFVFGVIVQRTGSWTYPFLVAAAILVVGALLWLLIRPGQTVAEELSGRKPAVSLAARHA